MLGQPLVIQIGHPPWPSGYNAWLSSVSSASGLALSLYKCAALWKAVYGSSTTGRLLGTICEEKGISSHRDMT